MGVETILIYRGEQILRGFDDDLRVHLSAEMQKKGIEIRTRADVSKIEKSGDGVRVTLEDGAAFGAGHIMFATGRLPNVVNLGLENAGVELTPHYAVKVDEYSRTTADNIYAVGDVTNRVNLTPVAIREGQTFADNVFGGMDVKTDHTLHSNGGFLPAGNRHHWPDRSPSPQGPREDRHLQINLPPHEAHAFRPR